MADDKTGHVSSPLPLERAFVLQFGSNTAPARSHFEGRVEHISSGQVMHFQSLEELLVFFEQTIACVTTPNKE